MSVRQPSSTRGSDLTERYVHATLRTVPTSRREEIGRELRSSIQDMVDARADAGEPADVAERAVLTELGDPDHLAVRYTGTSQALIGPRYFLTWWRLLVRLLVVVPVVVMVVVAVVGVVDGLPFEEVVGDVVGTGLSLVVQVAFWTTLVFALIDRFGRDEDVPQWSVDALPDLPVERSVSASDTIASIVFYAATIVAIVVQHFAGWARDDGESGPALDPDLWSFWLPLILVVLALGIVFEVAKWVKGRWTFGLAVTNVVLSVASVGPVVYLLLQKMLFSDLLVEATGMTDEVQSGIAVGASIVLVAVTAWEIVDGFVRAGRAPKSEPAPAAA